MSLIFKKHQFSFIQFGDNIDGDIMPVSDDNDIAFQLLLNAGTLADADSLMNQEITVHLVDNDSAVTDNASLIAATLLKYDLTPLFADLYRISDETVLLYWEHGFPGFKSAVLPDQCFRICLVVEDPATGLDQYPLSNTLKRVDDKRYTSLLEYYCDENAYDFYYCNYPVLNRVRVPFHLQFPQFTEERSIYRRSDGTIKINKVVSNKEYQGITDYFKSLYHEKLKMALSHDHVSITCDEYTGGVSMNSYEVLWIEEVPKTVDQEAQAKFKALATPYNWRNTNCQECEPWAAPSPCVIYISGVSVEDGPSGSGSYTYLANWVNNDGMPDHVDIEISLDNGVSWQAVANGSQVSDTSWQYDLAMSGPVFHMVRLTPYCDATTAGNSDTGSYENTDCGVTQNVTFSAVDNGDGTQTITINFDPLGSSTALTISRSSDGITFTNNSTGAPNGPRVYTMPLGKWFIKLESVGTCAESIIYPNIGL